MNRLTLVGRLTRDPELRVLPSGTTVCNMRLAVDGRRDDDTVFIDVATFGAQAEACARYLNQGRQVAFDGRLAYHQWTADDGTMRSKHSAIGHVGFLDGRGQTGAGDEQAAESDRGGADDDIPTARRSASVAAGSSSVTAVGLPPRPSRRTHASTTVTSGQDIGPPLTLNEPATANGVRR